MRCVGEMSSDLEAAEAVGCATPNPKVTVLMPVYNGERFLREALDSVLTQTFTDFELLVVNDGSTDQTATILESYSDRRLRIVTNRRNIGVAGAIRRGLDYARGEYVARIDADDIALPERLEKQVEYLDLHPEVGMVASLCLVIDEDGRPAEGATALTPEQIYYSLGFYNSIFNPSVTFRKAFVLSLGGYGDDSTNRVEDYDLWVRIARRAKIVQLHEVLAYWRESRTNATNSMRGPMSEAAKRVFLKNLQSLTNNSVAAEELLCFHYLGDRDTYPVVTIRYRSLLLLEEVQKKLVVDAPEGLRKSEIEDYCQSQLRDHICSIFLNHQAWDMIRVVLNSRYRKLLLTVINGEVLKRHARDTMKGVFGTIRKAAPLKPSKESFNN
jgi:glycosyltransferase involved in cell wall biosynthesis